MPMTKFLNEIVEEALIGEPELLPYENKKRRYGPRREAAPTSAPEDTEKTHPSPDETGITPSAKEEAHDFV
jgi:hypothetical protein